MTLDMDSAPKGRRVAVIGSGLAGLTTAYLLRQRGLVVYLIEKSDILGFHSSSIDIPPSNPEKTSDGSGGKGWTVDVPMRSFQGGYYPHLIALYRHLGIPMVATSYTFSFARLISSTRSSRTSDLSSNETPRTTTSTRSSTTTKQSSIPPSPSHSPRSARPHFIHSGASGKSIPSLPSSAYTSPLSLLAAIITLISYAGCYILLLALSFLSYHHLLPSLFSGTLWDFTEQISIFLYHPLPLIYTPFGIAWRNFVGMIVIPLFSSVGTMPESEVWGTNVGIMLDYIHKTVGTDHYHPAPGFSARTIAERLAGSVTEQGEGKRKGYLRLGSQVKSVKYDDGEIVVELEGEDLKVDRVVLATPASVASTLLGMLEGSLADEGVEMEMKRVRTMKAALKGVRYKETIVVTHRDSSILPEQADVRDINLIHPNFNRSSDSTKSRKKSIPNENKEKEETPYLDPNEGYTMATHVIRPPCSYSSTGGAVYQTTNPCLPIQRDSILGIARLERALPLSNPTKTIPLLHPSHGMIYLAGSYAYPGIPLLEGCVGSAKRVTEALIEDLGVDDGYQGEGEREMVDWSKGRGGFIGRLWRWRKKDGQGL